MEKSIENDREVSTSVITENVIGDSDGSVGGPVERRADDGVDHGYNSYDESDDSKSECGHRRRMMDKLMTRVKAIDYQILDLQEERDHRMRQYTSYSNMRCSEHDEE